MFNKIIDYLADQIFRNTCFVRVDLLRKHCSDLAIQIHPSYSRERAIFYIAQLIFSLLSDALANRVRRTSLNFIYEGKMMLQPSELCDAGLFQTAVLIFKEFCPKYNIWKMVNLLFEIVGEMDRLKPIMEVVRMNREIEQMQYKAKFTCHCEPCRSATDKPPKLMRCTQCLCSFHPTCQTQRFYCGNCFIRFCICDLGARKKDLFGMYHFIDQYFCGYLHIQSSTQRSISFHVIKFVVTDYIEMHRNSMDYSIEIKILDLDCEFGVECSTLQVFGGKKKRAKNMKNHRIGGIQFDLYLNHCRLNTPTFFMENCMIYRLKARDVSDGVNNLVLQCRSSEQGLMQVGIYKVKEVKQNIRKKQLLSNVVTSQTLHNIDRITNRQGEQFIAEILDTVLMLNEKKVSLIDVISNERIAIPVRSYSCKHLECFDLQAYRKQYLHKFSFNVGQVPLKDPQFITNQLMQMDFKLAENNPDLMERVNSSATKKKRKEKKEFLGCPVCKEPLFLLYIDPIIEQILRQDPQKNQAIIKKIIP